MMMTGQVDHHWYIHKPSLPLSSLVYPSCLPSCCYADGRIMKGASQNVKKSVSREGPHTVKRNNGERMEGQKWVALSAFSNTVIILVGPHQ